MNLKIWLVFTALSVLGISQTLAYIPSTANILRKTVKSQGDSAYKISQEVQFQIGPQSLLVQEQWTIEDGSQMRLEVRPAGAKTWSMDMIYSGQRRYVWDEDRVKSYPLSAEFVENIFHFRNLTDVLQRLVQLEFLPQRALKVTPLTGSTSTTQYLSEPWVRLGRTGGTLAFVLGESEKSATVWVEQDSFLFKRARFASQAEIVVDEHREHTPQLTFPQVRRYLWNQNSVLVRTTSVTPITVGPKTKESLSPQSLAKSKNHVLPQEDVVREFYSRFR